jgi:hypothetical protein
MIFAPKKFFVFYILLLHWSLIGGNIRVVTMKRPEWKNDYIQFIC